MCAVMKTHIDIRLLYFQVNVVSNMCNACSCMRCYVKGQSDSPLVQFCSQPNDVNDTGDGGGAKVFSLLSISSYGMSFMQTLILRSH